MSLRLCIFFFMHLVSDSRENFRLSLHYDWKLSLLRSVRGLQRLQRTHRTRARFVGALLLPRLGCLAKKVFERLNLRRKIPFSFVTPDFTSATTNCALISSREERAPKVPLRDGPVPYKLGTTRFVSFPPTETPSTLLRGILGKGLIRVTMVHMISTFLSG